MPTCRHVHLITCAWIRRPHLTGDAISCDSGLGLPHCDTLSMATRPLQRGRMAQQSNPILPDGGKPSTPPMRHAPTHTVPRALSMRIVRSNGRPNSLAASRHGEGQHPPAGRPRVGMAGPGAIALLRWPRASLWEGFCNFCGALAELGPGVFFNGGTKFPIPSSFRRHSTRWSRAHGFAFDCACGWTPCPNRPAPSAVVR
mmetsp:Transcript_63880/g.106701  ORF Transcript_63880/g.106701 Transcript_63880/m.106701 type:complete len:200 (-) Transcript_63880:127-726(-)